MSYNHYEDDYKDKKDVSCFCEVDKVCIGSPKPCITSIVEGYVKIEIKDSKVVKNCDGFKLIVEGCKYIKIKYCSNDKCGCNKIFTETFVVPFKQSVSYCGCYRDFCDLEAYVDECSMKKISSRCVVVKSKICIEPEFHEPEYDYWDDDWNCECKVEDCCRKVEKKCHKC